MSAPGLNPSATRMDVPTLLGRLLSAFQKDNGKPVPGAPNGPLAGDGLRITRVAVVGNANPVLAVGAVLDRRGMMVRNLDLDNPGWYSSSDDFDNTNGGTIGPGESLPINFSGPLYVYSQNAITIEVVEIYALP